MTQPRRSPEKVAVKQWAKARGRFLFGLLWLGLSCLHPLSWSAAPVVLHLKNGDRLSGEIVSESADRVVLKSPAYGKIRLAPSEITRREAPAKASPVAAPSAGQPIPPAVAARPAAPAVLPSGIATNKTLSQRAPVWAQPFLTNWHGNIQLGMDLGFGTTDRQTFYANANLNHKYDRVRNLMTLRFAYGMAEPLGSNQKSTKTANMLEGFLKTDLDLGAKRKIYLYDQTGAGYDEIRRHQFRFDAGAGVGYKVVERPRWTVNTEAGLQFQHFTFDNRPSLNPQLADTDSVAARLGENITWKLSDKLRLIQRLQVTPDVADPENFRARFELGMTYPFLKRVTLSLNIFDEYESRPATLVEKNQLQIQSTVGITF